MNYQGPDYSIYQAPVLYQVQSSLQTIAYFNLQTSTLTSALISMAYGLVTCIILDAFCIILDTPHDSRRAPVKVSVFDQVRSKPMYLSGLGATGLLPGGFCQSRHYFDFPEDEADVYTREKS